MGAWCRHASEFLVIGTSPAPCFLPSFLVLHNWVAMAEGNQKIRIVRELAIYASHGRYLTPLYQMKGAEPDMSAASFQIFDETHTLGNVLRWMLMKKCASYEIYQLQYANHLL